MAKTPGSGIVRICPKCGGKDTTDFSWALGTRYFCYTCGFSGPLFPMISRKDADKIKMKKRKFSPSWDSFVSPFPNIITANPARADIWINRITLLMFALMVIAAIFILAVAFYSQTAAPVYPNLMG